MVTPPFIFFSRKLHLLLWREYKGNIKKPNCKMWSAIMFVTSIIPNHTLFFFAKNTYSFMIKLVFLKEKYYG